jgi:hypothetical protein
MTIVMMNVCSREYGLHWKMQRLAAQTILIHLITIASRLAIITYYCNSQSKENSPLVRFVVPTYLTHAKQLKESLPHFVTQMTDFHVTFLRCEAASYRLLLWMRE